MSSWYNSRGWSLLRDTWSYLGICQRSVLPYTWFCYCLLDYDCVLHIVNFAILYIAMNSEKKDTSKSDKSAWHLDIWLNVDSNDRLTTKLYDKRDDFDFAIANFPFLCSNTPLSPTYGVGISKLIRYARACFAYEDFSKRWNLLTNKLILQGCNESRLKSSFFEILRLL
jgi:hypothetical protein